MDGLTSAENIGLLVRNCAAFGVQALIVGETSSSPFLRRAVRNSMGAIFQLPVVELQPGIAGDRDAKSCRRPARAARARGSLPGGASAHGQKFLSQADFRGDCCLVFGSEGNGLSPAVLAACDEAVAVPMANGVSKSESEL